MRPRNRLQPIHVVKLGSDLIAKQPTRSSRAHRPRVDILRVTPHQIAKRAFMRDLLRSSHNTDLVDGSNFGRQAAVDAQDGPVHDCCED